MEKVLSTQQSPPFLILRTSLMKDNFPMDGVGEIGGRCQVVMWAKIHWLAGLLLTFCYVAWYPSVVLWTTAVTYEMCQKWFAKFPAGDFLLDDTPWLSRPIEVDSYQIETLIENNQHYISRERANILKLSK